MGEKEKPEHEKDSDHIDEIIIQAVVDGRIVPIEEVDDQIFAQKMIGDGYGIYPTSETVYAPCDCKVEQIASTKHAIYLSLPNRIKILIHIGIDTIELKGEGFETDIENGMWVEKGQPLVHFDSKRIEGLDLDPVVAVIILDTADKNLKLQVFPTEEAKANETTAMILTEQLDKA